MYIHIFTHIKYTHVLYISMSPRVDKSVFVGRTQTREVRDGVDMIGNR